MGSILPQQNTRLPDMFKFLQVAHLETSVEHAGKEKLVAGLAPISLAPCTFHPSLGNQQSTKF